MNDRHADDHGDVVRWGTPAARWVLVATVLGSGMAFMDTTVVNVALPALGEDLGANVAGLQWTLNGYLVTLAALILLGGSLGDRFGRRRVFLIGVVWFAIASAACAAAVSVPMLVGARAVQGIGGALLTPGSLAILQSGFEARDRAKAIGAWSGFSGISSAIGPFIGGWLVDVGSWRYIFLLNLPLAVVVLVVAVRHVPESRDSSAAEELDIAGALFAAVGLAGVNYSLIAAGERGADFAVVLAGVLGVAALVGFVLVERRSSHPMLPLGIFSSDQFTAANVVTVPVYAALGTVLFLLIVHLQVVLGYSALQAGVASLPVTVIMLLLSARAGELAQRIGPRSPMTVGPLVIGVGLALMTGITAGTGYLGGVLPPLVVLGLGLSLTVAPLTSTVLAAADPQHAGVASGVNNAVARAAQLAAIAVVPVAAGITGDAYTDPVEFAAGFRVAMLITAGLAAAGGVVAWATIRNPLAEQVSASHGAPPCAVDSPPMDA